MKKENQRVAISKRLLREGLMKLLNQKHINDISVSELCEVSGINRTTFYRHYQTPRDVLLEIEFDFISNFYDVPISFKDVKGVKKYTVHMCEFLDEHRDIVKLFIQNNTDSDLILISQNLFNNFLDSREVLYKRHRVGSDTIRLMQTFFGYGIYALVCQWISEDVSLTAEEVADLIVGSINNDFSFQQIKDGITL